MKRLTLLLALAALCTGVKAQDTLAVKVQVEKNDTMRIGNILIIKKGKRSNGKDSTLVMRRVPKKTNSKITTNYFVLDLGFSNYSDQTDYGNTGSYLVNRPGSPAFGKSDFKLQTGKASM